MNGPVSCTDLEAMDSKDLRSIVAALRAENSELKSRLVEFERRDAGWTALKCPNCGFGRMEEERAMEPASDPCLPNEIFLLIAEYFDPGTRSLFQLARTCSALYDLLLPRLYESFSAPKVYEKVRNAFPMNSSSTVLPHGLSLVKTLDAGVPSGSGDSWEDKNRMYSVRSCFHVVDLRCGVAELDFALFARTTPKRLANLRVLEVHFTDAHPDLDLDSPSWTARMKEDIMPNLMKVKFSGAFKPNWLHVVNACHRLDEVRLDYGTLDDWDPTPLPGSMVPKIRTLAVSEGQYVSKTKRHFPSFAPLEIQIALEFDDIRPLEENDWAVLCRMDSLKKLEVREMESSLFRIGCPKFLEELVVEDFDLDFFENTNDLPALQSLISSLPSRIQFNLTTWCFDCYLWRVDNAEDCRLLAELKMWAELPGFKVKGDADLPSLRSLWEEFGI